MSQVDTVHLIKLFQADLRFPASVPAQEECQPVPDSPLSTSSTSVKKVIPPSCSYFVGWMCSAGVTDLMSFYNCKETSNSFYFKVICIIQGNDKKNLQTIQPLFLSVRLISNMGHFRTHYYWETIINI